ncbi:MAG: FHA domain-containing protein [Pirellulales bacterium]|nr:FHA domain-containing protein [Pirellulales bacterium]
MLGELHPLGGGDPIPLLKQQLLVGRRESCDIVLRFPNVSAHHCQLTLTGGYWYIKDLGSQNGVKVNGKRITTDEKLIEPGDTIAVAKHNYEVKYSPYELGAVGPPPAEDADTTPQHIFAKSLLERAGLAKPGATGSRDSAPRRYDVLNNSANQIRNPNKPV